MGVISLENLFQPVTMIKAPDQIKRPPFLELSSTAFATSIVLPSFEHSKETLSYNIMMKGHWGKNRVGDHRKRVYRVRVHFADFLNNSYYYGFNAGVISWR